MTMNKTDNFFYITGWILYAMLAVLAILQYNHIFTLTDLPGTCSFRQATGLYCPGCGGTHAICALAGGKLLESFRYHPLVPYTAACFAIFLIINSIGLIAAKKRSASHRRPFLVHFHIAYVYVGIGIILLQWIVKNILLK